MIRFITKVNKNKSKGVEYPRLVIAKYLDELGWKAGDQVIVEIDKGNNQIVVRQKNLPGVSNEKPKLQ